MKYFDEVLTNYISKMKLFLKEVNFSHPLNFGLLFILFNSLSFDSFGQREPVGIIVNSTKMESFNEELRFLVSGLFQENGFKLIERKEVDLLFSEYKDLKKEDYLNLETIKIKLEGLKYYCVLDVFETSDYTKVFLFFVDVFQENIIFSQVLIFDEKQDPALAFERYKAGILSDLNNTVPLKLYYYSSNKKDKVKFLVQKSSLQLGTRVVGLLGTELVCELKITENLSSNMVECEIRSFNNEKNGKIESFDFSKLTYQTQVNPGFNDQRVLDVTNFCLTKLEFYELIVGLNKNTIVRDNLHTEKLKFEQELQSNELFVEGKSYFEPMTVKEKFGEIYLSEITGICKYMFKRGDEILVEENFIDWTSMKRKIDSFIPTH